MIFWLYKDIINSFSYKFSSIFILLYSTMSPLQHGARKKVTSKLASKGRKRTTKLASTEGEDEPAMKTPRLSVKDDSQVQQLLRVLEKSIEKKNVDIEKFSGIANQDFSRWIEDFNFRTNTEDENTKLGLRMK